MIESHSEEEDIGIQLMLYEIRTRVIILEINCSISILRRMCAINEQK
jgi:hypothetical protein